MHPLRFALAAFDAKTRILAVAALPKRASRVHGGWSARTANASRFQGVAAAGGRVFASRHFSPRDGRRLPLVAQPLSRIQHECDAGQRKVRAACLKDRYRHRCVRQVVATGPIQFGVRGSSGHPLLKPRILGISGHPYSKRINAGTKIGEDWRRRLGHPRSYPQC